MFKTTIGSNRWRLNVLKTSQSYWYQLTTTRHWVGDGFHVHGLLRPSPRLNHYINPFILMDYGAPKYFPPQINGVGSVNILIEVLKR